MMSLRSVSFVLLAAFTVAAGAAACSSSAGDAGDAFSGPYNGASGDGSASMGTPPPDAGTGGGASDQNPICHVPSYDGCHPDDLFQSATSYCSSGLDAGSNERDADADASDTDASTIACRVTLNAASSTSSAQCTAAGPGTNGAACAGSDDCAAGFECVGSPGICRRYCCGLPTATCSHDFFCDVQSEKSAESVIVPVCEPVQPCSLLNSDAGVATMCDHDETCSIVNDDDGTTSCVAVGPAKVGESCDATHCGKDLVCLGEVTARKCYALCDKSQPSCAAGQTCSGSAPLFQGANASVGICQ